MIRFRCGKCKSRMEAPESMAAGVIRCPSCNAKNRIPTPKQNPKPQRSPKRTIVYTSIAVIAVSFALVGYAFYAFIGSQNKQNILANSSSDQNSPPKIQTGIKTEKKTYTVPDLVEMAKPAIVTIIAAGGSDEDTYFGTGFFIKRNLVATNYHVVKGAGAVLIQTQSGHTGLIGSLVMGDATADIAILRLIDSPLLSGVNPLQIASQSPREGEDVVIIGNPEGLEQTISTGIISAIRPVEGIGNVIQTTASISHGSSGSPIMTMDGKVIAIATLTYSKGQNLNFGTPISNIKDIDLTQTAHTYQDYTDYQAGLVLFISQDYEQAKFFLYRASFNEGLNCYGWNRLGYTQIKVKEWDDALLSFEKALELGSDKSFSLSGKALVYMETGRIRDAKGLIDQAIIEKYSEPLAHYALGVYLLKVDKKREAMSEYELLKPDNEELAKELLDLILNDDDQ